MVTMLVTISISKGWETWSEMAKGLEPQMNEVGSKSSGRDVMPTKPRFTSWLR